MTVLSTIKTNFAADQPRDEAGKFSSTGGGGGSSSSEVVKGLGEARAQFEKKEKKEKEARLALKEVDGEFDHATTEQERSQIRDRRGKASAALYDAEQELKKSRQEYETAYRSSKDQGSEELRHFSNLLKREEAERNARVKKMKGTDISGAKKPRRFPRNEEVENFDPDQPRDEAGKFTDGGATGTGGMAPSTRHPTDPTKPTGGDGKLTPERRKELLAKEVKYTLTKREDQGSTPFEAALDFAREGGFGADENSLAVGKALHEGLIVERDPEAARAWLEHAQSLGSAKASDELRKFDLNEAYHKEIGETKNVGRDFATASATRGHDEIVKHATEHGLSVEETKAKMTSFAQELVKGSGSWSRVNSKSLESILNDERFKTQHETGKSSGLLNSSKRMDAERIMFGTDPKSDVSTRPVYGYLAKDSDGALWQNDRQVANPKDDDPLAQYGRVAIKFKNETHDRTTFTVADSFDYNRGGQVPNLAPVSMSNPNWLAVGAGPALAPSRDTRPESSGNYTEAQIHGGVGLKDIDEVVFGGTGPGANLKKLLAAKGVKWRVAKDPRPKPAKAPKVLEPAGAAA